MSTDNLTQIFTATVERLSRPESLKELFHQHRDGDPQPSGKALEEIIELARAILFPGFYGKSTVSVRTLRYHIGVNLERLHKLLTDQITAGLCFVDDCGEDPADRLSCHKGCVVGANMWVTEDMEPQSKRSLPRP